jgi:hypothetical protein
MIQRVFHAVAGIDRKTILTCPVIDRIWAAHLGFSLCLSFVVVFGISFQSTGYMIGNVWVRLLCAFVIALTVFMFDRALFQSDWFYQGSPWSAEGGFIERAARWTRRFARISIRLAMSFGLAWVIAVFLELAIFSETISERLASDRAAVTQPTYQKIEQFEAQLTAEVERQRSSLNALETLFRTEISAPPPVTSEQSLLAQSSSIEQQIKTLDAKGGDLRDELRQVEETVRKYAADMNAEELGQKLTANSSGRSGLGPRYEFAARQKDVYEAQKTSLQSEIAGVVASREELRAELARFSADRLAAQERERASTQDRLHALQAQIDVARADLRQLEGTRLVRVEEFRRKALAVFDSQLPRDDPLIRMTAFQELKNDPKDGATISLFSWMIRFFIIFLEIVPVIAKMFFSPPSVYAARIRSENARESRRADSFEALAPADSSAETNSAVDLREGARPTAPAFAGVPHSRNLQFEHLRRTDGEMGRDGRSMPATGHTFTNEYPEPDGRPFPMAEMLPGQTAASAPQAESTKL